MINELFLLAVGFIVGHIGTANLMKGVVKQVVAHWEEEIRQDERLKFKDGLRK